MVLHCFTCVQFVKRWNPKEQLLTTRSVSLFFFFCLFLYIDDLLVALLIPLHQAVKMFHMVLAIVLLIVLREMISMHMLPGSQSHRSRLFLAYKMG